MNLIQAHVLPASYILRSSKTSSLSTFFFHLSLYIRSFKFLYVLLSCSTFRSTDKNRRKTAKTCKHACWDLKINSTSDDEHLRIPFLHFLWWPTQTGKFSMFKSWFAKLSILPVKINNFLWQIHTCLICGWG